MSESNNSNKSNKSSKSNSIKSEIDVEVKNKIYIKKEKINVRPMISDKIVLSYDKSPIEPIYGIDPSFAIIKATYITDLNIIKFHEFMRYHFSSILGNVEKKKALIKKIEIRSNRINSGVAICKSNDLTILKIKNEIDYIESGKMWEDYIIEAEIILDRYIPLASDKIKGNIVIDFNSKIQKEDNFTVNQIKERSILIQEYIFLISKFVKTDITWDCRNDSSCPKCFKIFKDMQIDEDKGIYLCSCGYEKPMLCNLFGWDNSTNINPFTKTAYVDFDTFKKAWYRHQGKCTDTIPNELIEMADEYFAQKKLPTKEEFRKMKTDRKGRKPGTSISMIIEMLKLTENPAYYKVYNVFGREYFGWILPDYKNQEEQVFADYCEMQPIYNEINKGSSSINVEVRICLHLLTLGVDVSFEEDFKTISRNSLIDHQESYRIMCEKTKKNFVGILG